MQNRGVRAIAIVSIAVGLAGIGTPVVSAAATAAKPERNSQTYLFANSVKVTTSTGKQLYLSIEIDRDDPARNLPSDTRDTDVFVDLSDNLGEDHDWDIEEPNSTFTFNQQTGVGHLRLNRHQFRPLGAIRLTITPTAKPTTKLCKASAYETTQQVALKETVDFKTQSAAWGRVHIKDVPSKHGSDIENDFGPLPDQCGSGTGPSHTCQGFVDWNTPGGDKGIIFGEQRTKKNASMYFDTFHTLKSTHDRFERDDSAFSDLSPPALTTNPDGSVTLDIDAGTTGLITGTATLTSISDPKIENDDCKGGTTNVWDASYTPGTTPLTVHMAIGGDFTPTPADTGATIIQDSSPA